MIFSKEEIVLAYTVEKCPKCNKLNRRDFSEGDVLFMPTSKCSFVMELQPSKKFMVKYSKNKLLIFDFVIG